jgi:hypothetical protein
MGGSIPIAETDPVKVLLSELARIPTLLERAPAASEAMRLALSEFILEGLYASDKIGRSEERGYMGIERKTQPQELYRDYTIERSRSKKPLN